MSLPRYRAAAPAMRSPHDAVAFGEAVDGLDAQFAADASAGLWSVGACDRPSMRAQASEDRTAPVTHMATGDTAGAGTRAGSWGYRLRARQSGLHRKDRRRSAPAPVSRTDRVWSPYHRASVVCEPAPTPPLQAYSTPDPRKPGPRPPPQPHRAQDARTESQPFPRAATPLRRTHQKPAPKSTSSIPTLQPTASGAGLKAPTIR
jgi:hypothetical protein